MDTWILIILTVGVAFVICMIIGFFGDRYLKKKDSKNNESQNSIDSSFGYEQSISNNVSTLDNSLNMPENKENAQVSGKNIVTEQFNASRKDQVFFEQSFEMPQNNTANMFAGEQLTSEQNYNNIVNMENNSVPIQNNNNQLVTNNQSEFKWTNNATISSFANSELQQSWSSNVANSTDPNLVPFDGNFSSDDNINNMF